MKYVLAIVILLCATLPAFSGVEGAYGKPLTGSETIEIAELLANPDKHLGQVVRVEGPQTHLKKAGTPTTGGLIILAGIVVPTLLWAPLTNFYII